MFDDPGHPLFNLYRREVRQPRRPPKPAANNYVSIVLDPAGNVALVLFPPTRKRSLSGDNKQDAPVSFFRIV